MKQEETTKERQKKEKSETQKLKVHKDFGFLLDISPVFINSHTAKYLLDQGIDDPVNEYKEDPFEAYVSFNKYDYDGKAIEKVASAKIASDKNEELREAMLSMKVKEKAWFNICNRPISRAGKKEEKIEHGSITEDGDEIEEDEEEKADKKEPEGFHYEMILERIQFKNSDKIEIKRKVNEQNKEKGRNLFKEEKYYEASKVYKFLINITENLPRNSPYTAEDRGEIESMNINAKLNYIRCYFKIKEDWNLRDLFDFAKQTVQSLLKKKPNAHTTHFYHAKWLLKERFLDDALEAAKRSNGIQRSEATDELIAEIIKEKQNKGKIKVAVKS